MEHQSRTYTITAGVSQELLDVHISDDAQRLALAWFLMPNGERQTTMLKIDGDERAIVAASLSRDKRKLIVTIEYVPGQSGRSDQIQMPLSELFTPEDRQRMEQCDVQTLVHIAKNTKPEPTRVHFCFTQTRDELNHPRG